MKLGNKILDFLFENKWMLITISTVLSCTVIIVSVKVFHNDYMRTNWHWSIALFGTAFTMLCLFIEEENKPVNSGTYSYERMKSKTHRVIIKKIYLYEGPISLNPGTIVSYEYNSNLITVTRVPVASDKTEYNDWDRPKVYSFPLKFVSVDRAQQEFNRLKEENIYSDFLDDGLFEFICDKWNIIRSLIHPSIGKKKLFKLENGNEGIRIDCDEYEVEFFPSHKDSEYWNDKMIEFKNKQTKFSFFLNFKIQNEGDENGQKLTLHFQDRWGSSMTFVHYPPSDLKGMFDFIAKGYNIYDKLISNERDS